MTIGIINIVKKNKPKNIIKYSQSHIHSIIGPFLPDIPSMEIKDTQSKKHMKESIIDVLITRHAAYWVHKGVFYTAKVEEDGSVDRSTTSKVNFDDMSDQEIKNMFVILDKLKDRANNEGRGTRDR